VAIIAVLAGGNIATTLMRTTVPRAFSGRVTGKTALPEKHPGVDDVCLVAIDAGPPIQVEHPAFDRVDVGDTVAKDAWSRTMLVEGEAWRIPWSRDFIGMLILMPALLVLALVLAALQGPVRSGRAGSRTDLG
jgi:hypothetical protein